MGGAVVERPKLPSNRPWTRSPALDSIAATGGSRVNDDPCGRGPVPGGNIPAWATPSDFSAWSWPAIAANSRFSDLSG